MPILRLNAGEDGLRVHGSPAPAMATLRRAAAGNGPVVVMVHGFKYDPDHAPCSPHSTIFALKTRPDRTDDVLWPRHLGFGTGSNDEGLAIAFGWRARGNIWRALRTSRLAGQHLAHVISEIRAIAPNRPVHIITHSMGSEVAFEALEHLPANSVARLVALTGASYAERAKAAMHSPAGRTCALFNITTRENDLFDFGFERLIAPPHRADRAMGNGVGVENAVTIQIDCPETLSVLKSFGGQIAGPSRRICHWSGYTRPGAMTFYARLMRQPNTVRLSTLKDALDGCGGARWSRLSLGNPLNSPLQGMHKAAS